MVRPYATIATVIALLTIGPLLQGQAPLDTPSPGTASTRSANLTVEQRHVIKEIVKDLAVTKAPANVQVEVGGTVPDSVTLSPIPVEVSNKVPQIRTHMYFVKGDQIVIVNQDKRIAEVID